MVRCGYLAARPESAPLLGKTRLLLAPQFFYFRLTTLKALGKSRAISDSERGVFTLIICMKMRWLVVIWPNHKLHAIAFSNSRSFLSASPQELKLVSFFEGVVLTHHLAVD